MGVKIRSIMESGSRASIVDVECHMTNGLPGIIIVGFANKAVDESKERIKSAFSSSKLELPRKRITINLAPADIPKDSTSFDLPIAVAILVAGGHVAKSIPDSVTFVGELSLDGSMRSVRGIVGKLLAAKDSGFTKVYVPYANLEQAKLVPGIELVGVQNLHALYLDLTETARLPIMTHDTTTSRVRRPVYAQDFADVIGQQRAKRALEIAAAGAHNILLNGAPGTGKSMLAKALPSILPEMSFEEILEVTHLQSLASKDYERIVTERPFRAPHHTASGVSIIGGGQKPKPGEISLAHRGVLFFDEFPEFGRAAIEALRQPLEDGTITITRANDSMNFPAKFMLVATSNPCPCGYFGTNKVCSCMPHHISRYRHKLSGPIMDRIDLYVDVDQIEHKALLSSAKEEPSAKIQKRVLSAREQQTRRYHSSLVTNSTLTNQQVKTYAKLTDEAKNLLDTAAQQLDISPRGYMRAVKVARTIADLAKSEVIDTAHIGEALQYRRPKEILV